MSFDYPPASTPKPPPYRPPNKPGLDMNVLIAAAAIALVCAVVAAVAVTLLVTGGDTPPNDERVSEVRSVEAQSTTSSTTTTQRPTTTTSPPIDDGYIAGLAADAAWAETDYSDRQTICEAYRLYGDDWTWETVQDTAYEDYSDSGLPQQVLAFAMMNKIRRECG